MKREVKADRIINYLAAGYAGFVVRTTESKRAAEVLVGIIDGAVRKDKNFLLRRLSRRTLRTQRRGKPVYVLCCMQRLPYVRSHMLLRCYQQKRIQGRII